MRIRSLMIDFERTEMIQPVSIDDASARLREWVSRWRDSSVEREELVGLRECSGRMLAYAVAVDRPLPPYHRVMMDGVAVREDDWNAGRREFVLTGVMPAGCGELVEMARGTAVEVMTGSVCPLPPEEMVVVPVECLAGGMPAIGDKLEVNTDAGFELAVGAFIHRRGVDAAAGDTILDRGTVIGPAEVGILASCGIDCVRVRPMVKVAVISTGDELVEVDEQPEDFQIRRSNDVVIDAFVRGMGAEVLMVKNASDQRQELATVINECAELVDLVIFSGGASKGSRDFVPELLTARCGSALFQSVRQRPGKPFGVWDGGDTLFCALPGNPASVMACLCRHVGPLIRRMMGLSEARMKRRYTGDGASGVFRILKPVKAVDGHMVEPLELNNSGDFAGLAGLAGFVELPEDNESDTEVVFYPVN